MESFLQRAQADGGTECAQWRPLLHEAIEASCFPHRFFSRSYYNKLSILGTLCPFVLALL